MSRKKALCALLVMTALVYWPVISSGFVGDDFLVVANNQMIDSWRNLPSLFTSDYLTTDRDLVFEGVKNIGSGETSYRPLVTLSYFIDRHLWGLEPAGYHLTNLLLHAGCVLLLFFVVMELSLSAAIAFIAALLFALHPVNTEAVDVISYREDLLAFLFAMASFVSYRRSKLASSAIFYLAALFSKESAAALPLIMLADQVLMKPAEPVKKARWAWTAVFSAASLFYAAAWMFFTQKLEHMVIPPYGGALTQLLTALKVFGVYAVWILWPTAVHVWVPEPTFHAQSFTAQVLSGTLFLTAAVMLIAALRKRSALAAFGLVWFLLALLPVSGIIPTRHVIAARYLYLPMGGAALSIAVFFLAGDGLARKRLGDAAAGRLRFVVWFLMLMGLSFFTLNRHLTFRDNAHFWDEAARVSPNNGVARMARASSLAQAGHLEEAIEDYQAAIRLGTELTRANYALGICYFTLRDFPMAVHYLTKAVELDPANVDAKSHLGIAVNVLTFDRHAV